MHLRVTGVNHRTCPPASVERHTAKFEKVFLEVVRAVRDHRERTRGPAEAVLLSTCNRFEIVSVGDERLHARLRAILRANGVPARHLAVRDGIEAALHVLRIAAGLESIFPGETLVMSQIRAVYGRALAAGATGPITNRLFQRSLAACRSARTHIDGPADARSLAEAGLRRAATVFPLEGVPYALIGDGPAVRTFAKLLPPTGAGPGLRVIRDHHGDAPGILNLTLGRPKFAACRLFVVESPTLRYDLGLDEIRAARERFGEIAILDYSLSRGVDPACRDLEGVFHFNRDELEPTDRARGQRAAAEARATEAIEAAAGQFQAWYDQHGRDRVLAYLMEGVAERLDAALDAPRGPEAAADRFIAGLSADLRRKLKLILDAGPVDLPRLLERIDHAGDSARRK